MGALARVLMAVGILAGGSGGLVAGQEPASNPEPAPRHGFWFGAGFGIGSLGRTCDICDNLPGESGPTAYIKAGGTPDRQMAIGVELTGWHKKVQGSTITSGSALVVVSLYPSSTSGLFLKGGLGGSLYRQEAPTRPASDTAQTTGFGLTAGIGYDVPVAAHVYLTPVANFVFGSLGNIRPGGVFMPGVQQTLLQLALGVTFH